MEERSLPPFLGIRIKPLTEEFRDRSLRTLDVFLTAQEGLPENFVVNLPKVTVPGQVAALADALDILDPDGSVKIELMVETPQSILDLPRLVQAGKGRTVAAHFGTYDYTALCSITATHQHHEHRVCDFARQMMKVALAGTGIMLSDGATNILPVPPRAAVHRAWKLHYDHVRYSLANGYYQGWDLHPAQLPTRYAAVFAFFQEELKTATDRLRHFMAEAARSTLSGDVFDDAATGQGLLNFFLRGINCGAIEEYEATRTGITVEELRGRSFVKILENRK